MGTLVNIVDAIVLLLYIVAIPRLVLKGLHEGLGAKILAICVAGAVIVFAFVSVMTSLDFFTSGLGQFVWLVVLLGIGSLVGISSGTSANPTI